MSLATALKGAVADARPLQNADFRRLWVTQIITMIGAQLGTLPESLTHQILDRANICSI